MQRDKNGIQYVHCPQQVQLRILFGFITRYGARIKKDVSKQVHKYLMTYVL